MTELHPDEVVITADNAATLLQVARGLDLFDSKAVPCTAREEALKAQMRRQLMGRVEDRHAERELRNRGR